MRNRTALASFMGGFFVIWVITAILSLAATGLGIYVVYHFVMKFW